MKAYEFENMIDEQVTAFACECVKYDFSRLGEDDLALEGASLMFDDDDLYYSPATEGIGTVFSKMINKIKGWFETIARNLRLWAQKFSARNRKIFSHMVKESVEFDNTYTIATEARNLFHQTTEKEKEDAVRNKEQDDFNKIYQHDKMQTYKVRDPQIDKAYNNMHASKEYDRMAADIRRCADSCFDAIQKIVLSFDICAKLEEQSFDALVTVMDIRPAGDYSGNTVDTMTGTYTNYIGEFAPSGEFKTTGVFKATGDVRIKTAANADLLSHLRPSDRSIVERETRKIGMIQTELNKITDDVNKYSESVTSSLEKVRDKGITPAQLIASDITHTLKLKETYNRAEHMAKKCDGYAKLTDKIRGSLEAESGTSALSTFFKAYTQCASTIVKVCNCYTSTCNKAYWMIRD